MPKISVIMPVYNAENFLRESIESILNQTFKDFEFLIINDGSTDSSADIIRSYTDSRINFIDNKDNLFYMKRLNEALEVATGEYIARMDSDDISLPERFQKQVEFLDANPEVGIVGGFWQMFGAVDRLITVPEKHENIYPFSVFHSPFGHPAVMFRKSMFDANNLRYREDYPYAEDYELWTRALKLFKGANLQEVLLNYRVHSGGVTSARSGVQQDTAKRVRQRVLEELGIFSEENLDLHTEISKCYNLGKTLAEARKGLDWLEKIYFANKEKQIYPEKELYDFLNYIGYFLAYNAHFDGLKTYFYYRKSILADKVSKKKLFEACFKAEKKNLKRKLLFRSSE